ncbi:MAG: oligopeptide/dipeptide ABC transporter ATP-binding protein [Clostridiaceae bacterium]|nr:ATP-binding cassette domain-containing protein [Eubacteriales bacterium]
MAEDILLQVKELFKYFAVPGGKLGEKKKFVKAVDGVSIDLQRGWSLGIVGESGCGKTTLVNTLLGLEEATGGEVIFDGKSLFQLGPKEKRDIKKDIQIVFQDPFWSLNPRMLVRDIIAEPLVVHTKLRGAALDEKVKELMKMVGLNPDETYMYPHEFSAGQRQRIAIARALALEPKLIVLDEPTSSIDVASQGQILKLLEHLKEMLHLTVILISHDLSVVYKMSDVIAVMYLGKLVEYGDAKKVFSNPQHPYTKALFGAVLRSGMKSLDELQVLEGNVPSAIAPPPGCRFHTRCKFAADICSNESPILRDCDGRLVACHLYNTDTAACKEADNQE